MLVNGLLGILTGGAMVPLATNSFQADAAGVMGSGSTPGIWILLGLGLVWLGIRGRKYTFQGTPINGRYLALEMNEGGEFSRGTPVSAMEESEPDTDVKRSGGRKLPWIQQRSLSSSC